MELVDTSQTWSLSNIFTIVAGLIIGVIVIRAVVFAGQHYWKSGGAEGEGKTGSEAHSKGYAQIGMKAGIAVLFIMFVRVFIGIVVNIGSSLFS